MVQVRNTLTAFLVLIGLAAIVPDAGAQTPTGQFDAGHGVQDGLLHPGTTIVSSGACSHLDAGQVEVRLGDSSFVTSSFPHTVLEFGGVPRLVLDRTPGGALAVSGSFGVEPGGPAIILDHNVFQVDTDLAVKTSRPDPTRLIVYGPNGVEALNVWYANGYTVFITGVMYFGLWQAIITDKGMNIGPHISRMCVKNSGTDIAIR